jgi:hypothetical protein
VLVHRVGVFIETLQGWPKVPPSIIWWNGQTRGADADGGAGAGDSWVETIDVVADKGYFKIEDIEACEKAVEAGGMEAVRMTGACWGTPQNGQDCTDFGTNREHFCPTARPN